MEHWELAAVVGIIASYPAVLMVLGRLVHPARLRMAELGGRLLESKLTEQQKAVIRSTLDDAFDWRVMWLFALALPVCVVRCRSLRSSLDGIQDADLKADVDTLMSLSMRSAFAASPVAGLIVTVEMTLLAMVLVPFGLVRKLDRIQTGTLEWTDRRLKHS